MTGGESRAVSEVVSGNNLGVDLQLAEDDLRHGALHSVAAASAESLRVSEEGECCGEELLPFFQPARYAWSTGRW